MLFGVERARIARDEVSLVAEVFGVGRTWQYDPRAVSRLRALEGVESPFGASADRCGTCAGKPPRFRLRRENDPLRFQPRCR